MLVGCWSLFSSSTSVICNHLQQRLPWWWQCPGQHLQEETKEEHPSIIATSNVACKVKLKFNNFLKHLPSQNFFLKPILLMLFVEMINWWDVDWKEFCVSSSMFTSSISSSCSVPLIVFLLTLLDQFNNGHDHPHCHQQQQCQHSQCDKLS